MGPEDPLYSKYERKINKASLNSPGPLHDNILATSARMVSHDTMTRSLHMTRVTDQYARLCWAEDVVKRNQPLGMWTSSMPMEGDLMAHEQSWLRDQQLWRQKWP